MIIEKLSIRDAFLLKIDELMLQDSDLILLTADMGAPLLDPIIEKYPDRIINVGIAEQNAINVAAGLAIEGHKVCVYGIAAFLFSRALEQIKVSLTMNAHFYEHMNVTILGVGPGLSYELSGPPHHAVEDVSVLNMIPGVEIYYPYSSRLAFEICEHIINKPGIKYVRLDSGSINGIPSEKNDSKRDGFHALINNKKIAVISSGPMIERIHTLMTTEKIDFSLFSFYQLNNINQEKLLTAIEGFETIIFAEECYRNKGVLQIEISRIIQENAMMCRTISLGLDNHYFFMTGTREYLHNVGGLGDEAIIKTLRRIYD